VRIAIISAFLHHETIGGAENHIRFLSKEFVRRGHSVRSFKPTLGGAVTAPLSSSDGVEIETVRIPFPVDLRKYSGQGLFGRPAGVARKLLFSLTARPLVRAVLEYEPDLVWQHDFLSSWLACKQLSRSLPVVLTNHQGQYIVLNRYGPGRSLLRFLLAHYSAIIGPSQELTPAWRDSCFTIYNGFDGSFFYAVSAVERTAIRARMYGAEQGDLCIFCPRRWAPTKGVLVFVEAVIAMCRNDGELAKRIVVLFAGNGYSEYRAYSEEVAAAVRRLPCRYSLLGDLDVYAMAPHYQAADVVVIPSFLEAVSLSALEAMACGSTVVSSAVGGMRELIDDGRTGFLVPPGDTQRLAAVLQSVLADSHVRSVVGNAGRENVKSRFTWDRIADQAEEVLAAALLNSTGQESRPAARAGAIGRR
jgi:glycosyltransferase involved in cell wall biosynthesis